ncbi:MAG: hypothetical protein E7163_01100 [Firmicutes bacterium]|nr:hypothetical protein [Bacillota bacterium]
MKKYYSTLSNDDKKKIKDIYQKEYKGTDLNKRFIKLFIYFILGSAFSVYLFIDAFSGDKLDIGTLIMAITLLTASLVFLIGRYRIKLDVLNKIALKNK